MWRSSGPDGDQEPCTQRKGKTMLRFVLFLMLAFSSCTHATSLTGRQMRICDPPEIVVYDAFDSSIPGFRTYIRDAVRFWNGAAGGRVLYDMGVIDAPGDSHTPAYIRVSVGADKGEWHGRTIGKAHRWTHRLRPECLYGSEIILNWNGGLGEDAQYSALVHELGHAIGLEHSAEHGTVMFPRIRDELPKLGSDTAETLKLLYGDM